MPNHCETDLTITAPSSERLREVMAAYFTAHGELDCGKVIPYPDEFTRLDEAAQKWDAENGNRWSAARPRDGFNSGGYEWCVENWGTKWGTYDGKGVIYSKNGKTAHLSFRSAWSPPTPVLTKLAELCPDLKLVAKSYEMGMAYKVDARWEAGKCVKDVTSRYNGHRGG